MKKLCIVIFVCFFSSSAFAQVPGNPSIDTDFRTYSDAIVGLVNPFIGSGVCPGLVASNIGDINTTDYTTSDPVAIDAGFNDLSRELRQLCTSIFNGSSGGTLSGGFAEPFSTRTFLPFTIDTTRPPPPPPGKGNVEKPVLSFLPTRNNLNSLSDEPGLFTGVFTGYDYWISFGAEAISYDVDTSDFQTGRSGNGFRGELVFGRQFLNGSVAGIGASYGKIDTDEDSYSFLVSESSASRPPSAIEDTVASVEDFCRDLDRGSEDIDTWDLNAFYAGSLSKDTTFQVFGGVRHTRTYQSSPLCLLKLYDSASDDEVFAGYLNGEPEEWAISLGAQAERRWTVGRTLFSVRGGAVAENRSIDGYTQNEMSVDASSPPINESGPIGVFDTGLALEYADRDVFTLTTELGLRAVWEFGGPRNPSAFWVDAAYQHVFGDTDERISASFAGDGRSTRTRFTFRGNPIQKNRITLKTGVDYILSDQLTSSLFVSGSFTDLTETYGIGAAFRWRF